jgi:hypothetical protein
VSEKLVKTDDVLLEEQLGKIVNLAVTNVGSSPSQIIFPLTSFGRHRDRDNNGTVAKMRRKSQSTFCCCQEMGKTTKHSLLLLGYGREPN